MKGSTLVTGLRRAAGSLLQPTAPRTSPSALRTPAIRHSTASFSTSISRRAEFLEDDQKVKAAPEIDLDGQGDEYHTALMKRVRVVPASPSYFTGRPRFTDDFLELQALVRKYETWPQIDPLLAPRVAWKSLDEYQSMGTPESIRISRWRRLQQLLQRLNYIHPTIMPEEVSKVMERYKRPINPYSREPAPKVLDEMGRGKGSGRRKTCSAVAWLVEGDGEVVINSKPLHQAFHRLHDRESALWALKATNRLSNYNLFAIVRGGGTTGWAEALTVAVARALLAHEPGLKTVLRRGRPDIPQRNPSSLCFV
ncbi:mitochondrial 37S ribosomal protein uS9m [Phyllosticta citriasiana]|uniref:mitochondrial 37S ribosomal protein uS9m n=1 Tax=Phyllosticta citriasiana TaxID=595635 RepID=UPI0030FDB3A2